MSYELKSARYLAQQVMAAAIVPGARVIDATMGNGHDTAFLAELVGEGGLVFAFDVQEAAVEKTRERLRAAGLLERCRLFAKGHEQVREEIHEAVDAVMFNLGWLPGGDKSVTTRWESTHQAVENCLALLKKGGVLTLCAYPGHPEGEREREKLTAYFAALRPQAYNVLHQRFLNAGPGAPECFVIQKQ